MISETKVENHEVDSCHAHPSFLTCASLATKRCLKHECIQHLTEKGKLFLGTFVRVLDSF